MGRPSIYSDELLAQVCDILATGVPLAVIGREPGMPAYRTVKSWEDEVDEDGKPTERARKVSAALARACAEGREVLGAQCLEIADDGAADYVIKRNSQGEEYLAYDSEHVQRSRLKIDTRLKLLAVWDRAKWGDKVQHADANGNVLPPAPQFVVQPVMPAPRDSSPE